MRFVKGDEGILAHLPTYPVYWTHQRLQTNTYQSAPPQKNKQANQQPPEKNIQANQQPAQKNKRTFPFTNTNFTYHFHTCLSLTLNMLYITCQTANTVVFFSEIFPTSEARLSWHQRARWRSPQSEGKSLKIYYLPYLILKYNVFRDSLKAYINVLCI